MRPLSSAPPGLSALDPATQALLERRAKRLRDARAEQEQTEDAELAVAEFPIGDELFAFPLAAMRGVVPLRRVTLVPLAPAPVIGIFRFHGQVTTALSLPSLLGGRSWRSDPGVLVVVHFGAQRLVGFDCEQVPRPSSLPRAALEVADLGSAADPWNEVALPGRRTVRVLDVQRLVARSQGGGGRGA